MIEMTQKASFGPGGTWHNLQLVGRNFRVYLVEQVDLVTEMVYFLLIS